MLELEDVLCHVTISTEYSWGDSEYIDLSIEFKDGPLEGKTYKIDVLKGELEK